MSRQTKTPTPADASLAFEEDYLDIDHWPHGWRVEQCDLLAGERMVDIFKGFAPSVEPRARSQNFASASRSSMRLRRRNHPPTATQASTATARDDARVVRVPR
jgi:hypothetical protein